MGLLRGVEKCPGVVGRQIFRSSGMVDRAALPAQPSAVGLGMTTHGDPLKDGVQGRVLQPSDHDIFRGWSASPASQRRGIFSKEGKSATAVGRASSVSPDGAGRQGSRQRSHTRCAMSQRGKNSRIVDGQIFLFDLPLNDESYRIHGLWASLSRSNRSNRMEGSSSEVAGRLSRHSYS
jgi:hypothetical protein